MNRRVPLLVMSLLLVAVSTMAGPEKIAFPQYQTHLLYTVVDRPDIKEIRDVYVIPAAAKMAKPGQPLPNGTVLTFVHFKAKVNETGALVKDPNGRLVRGELDRIGVMEKRTGWGIEYPEDIRNGEWEYALFRPDGTRNDKANIKGCFQCHKPLPSGQDFVFTFSKLVEASK
ncbi:MAG: hypothetical protein G01um1014106_374 [Parcubacteria group bacterium Gr01-1014_106]|nr:MAG: hypothetical protein G01um1014106_374 [Parcubacteria group bacterium Gr01-1014_106]